MSEFEEVYETMLGEIIPELAVPWVEDAFEEGGFCAQAYEEVQEAYERLRDRLGFVNEDADVEIIISRLQDIQKELCMRIFSYGQEYEQQEKARMDESMQKYL